MMRIVNDDEPVREFMAKYRVSAKSYIIVFERGEHYYAELRLRLPKKKWKTKTIKGWKSRSFVKLVSLIDGFIEGVHCGQSILL